MRQYYNRTQRAKGTTSKRTEMKSIAVRFDDETFDYIANEALKEGISFAEKVRVLTEVGLETLELERQTVDNFLYGDLK